MVPPPRRGSDCEERAGSNERRATRSDRVPSWSKVGGRGSITFEVDLFFSSYKKILLVKGIFVNLLKGNQKAGKDPKSTTAITDGSPLALSTPLPQITTLSTHLNLVAEQKLYS